ncbi:hypothetical protein L484_026560 [Morus notabilis]|uniref:Uncharacterized protein n=1 Tax=Morus notabilis TaxID=981085 RepID=W9QP75_9ROSA|nr:hypothetical protein L484_026560 [Morus notabilis]
MNEAIYLAIFVRPDLRPKPPPLPRLPQVAIAIGAQPVISIMNRSMSDQSIMKTTNHSPPKLCTNLSRKEIPRFKNRETENLEVIETPKKKEEEEE